MIKSADRSLKLDFANVSAAPFRPVCCSLFARLTRSPPAHICLLSNDLSLIPDCGSAQLSHFHVRFRLRNPPRRAHTHGFCLRCRFSFLCCSAAAQRGWSRSGSLCRTARRSRKEADVSAKSGRRGSATAGTKGAERVAALLRTKKCKLNTNTLDCKPQLL